MTQLELLLNWKTLKQEDCPHTTLRYDGLHLDEIHIATCYHPHRPHCGGTFKVEPPYISKDKL